MKQKGRDPMDEPNLLLRMRREELGLSQQQLADQIGVSARSIFNFEKGSLPSLEIALRLAAYLHLTVEQLFPLPGSDGTGT